MMIKAGQRRKSKRKKRRPVGSMISWKKVVAGRNRRDAKLERRRRKKPGSKKKTIGKAWIVTAPYGPVVEITYSSAPRGSALDSVRRQLATQRTLQAAWRKRGKRPA